MFVNYFRAKLSARYGVSMSFIKYPESVSFYKKTAELQVKLKKPEADADGRIIKGKEGCMFFEAAKAIPGDPDGRIDWNSKIVMKIGVNDIGQMAAFLSGKTDSCKLFHKNSTGASSTLELSGGTEGSVGFNISRKEADNTLKNAKLFLSGPDSIVLEELLKASLPIVLGY
jgi:hypothetical protein